jgi:hypothetical protein
MTMNKGIVALKNNVLKTSIIKLLNAILKLWEPNKCAILQYTYFFYYLGPTCFRIVAIMYEHLKYTLVKTVRRVLFTFVPCILILSKFYLFTD